MAEQDQDDQGDDLEITEDEARQLLDKPTDDKDNDPEGAEHLGDPGRRALESIKEQRRQARQERDKLRAELEQARNELRKHADKDKTELQRLAEERDRYKSEWEQTTSRMRRREVAEDRAPDHATAAQIRAVAKRLQGDSDDALAQDADELFALIAPAPKQPPAGAKPKERLRGGGDPPDASAEELNPRKLAALIPRAR